MSCTIIVQSEEAKDRAATLRNRARHGVNKNLLFWYRELYRDQLRDFSKPEPLSRVFRFALLAPHPTCLLVGYRAGCRSQHFLITRYFNRPRHQWPPSALLCSFFTVTLARR